MNIFNNKLFIALDESGKFNSNDVAEHFVIGGFFYSNKDEVKIAIKMVEEEVRRKYHIKGGSEIKGNNTPPEIIGEYINTILLNLDVSYIQPVFSVVSRSKIDPSFTMSETLAYNFFVNNLVDFWQKRLNFDKNITELTMLIDERNLKDIEINNLEVILKSNFIEHPWNVTSYYLESAKTDVVRFADLLAHVMYTHFNNPNSDKCRIYKEKISPRIYKLLTDGCFYYPYNKSWFKK